MGRPKKAALASRANGSRATNKGKLVHAKKELFGGYDNRGKYVIMTIQVPRKVAKGEVLRREFGCELDVFTFCLYHGKFARFDDGKSRDKKLWKSGVDPDRWEAARERAKKMVEQCANLDPQSKMATLRKLTKDSKEPIRFGR